MISLSTSRMDWVLKRDVSAPLQRDWKEEVLICMYAIVATGGKQYKAEVNKVIKVEKLGVEVGATVKLDVLMLVDGDKVVAGAAAAKSVVNAEVLAQDKANKVVVFKYKAKKNERKRQGHRQPFTVLKIKEIKA